MMISVTPAKTGVTALSDNKGEKCYRKDGTTYIETTDTKRIYVKKNHKTGTITTVKTKTVVKVGKGNKKTSVKTTTETKTKKVKNEKKKKTKK